MSHPQPIVGRSKIWKRLIRVIRHHHKDFIGLFEEHLYHGHMSFVGRIEGASENGDAHSFFLEKGFKQSLPFREKNRRSEKNDREKTIPGVV